MATGLLVRVAERQESEAEDGLLDRVG